MKIKKRYLYGIVLMVLLMVLVGCSNNVEPEEEGEMGTPEGVILAYLNGFVEKDFAQIESMLEEAEFMGDVYIPISQNSPNSTLEIVESQHKFITHFYGEDAWENVEYELEEIMPDEDTKTNTEVDADVVTDNAVDLKNEIKEYSANFVFNDMPKHLMGFENIHILLSNESGAWVIKEGLSWAKNIYGGSPAPEYFKGSEAIYRGISGDSQPEDIKNLLGEPVYEEENEGGGDLPSYLLQYKDATYDFVSHIDVDGSLVRYYLQSIVVNSGTYNLPRNIKLGDTFYNTMEKFPRDKDWLIDPNNCFYGTSTLEGFGGACFTYEAEDGTIQDTLVFVPTDYTPYLKMEFTNGILKSAMMVYIQMQ